MVDSGNGGTTLEFLSPFLWRAPPLELRRKRREFFPEHAGKGSLRRARRRKRGSFGCGRDSRASSRVQTGMSGNFLSCKNGVKDPDILVSNREEAGESRPHPEEPRFRLLARRREPFSACSGENSRRFRRISRGGALHMKGERESRVVSPFPESPRCISPFLGNLFSLHCLDFQAEDRLTPRCHVGQP